MTIRETLSNERKQLQSEGKVPLWMTTDGYALFKEKYSVEGEESFKGRASTIAKTAAQYLKDSDKWEQKFFDLIWNGWLSCSTPVLSNMGTNRGMSVSCSGQYIGDSVDSFYTNLHESAILSKNGFGTSGYFGDIRPRGSKISIGGKTSGVLPVFDDFVQMSKKVSQGSNRRGAFAGYFPISHSDFDEVADYVKDNVDSTNVGWCWYDEDTKKAEQGDEETIRRFRKALKLKMLTGKGYFFFPDKVNNQNPQMYKDKELEVKSSNLCVAPETLILTKEGYQQIVTLENETVDVWNGKEWSPVVIRKTGENQKLLKVITDSGFELECTPYHKFYILERDPKNYRIIREVRAKDLVKGDKLIKSDFPIIDGKESLENAYANGFFSGDGCQFNGKKRIYLYHGKRLLKNQLGDIFDDWVIDENQNREYGSSSKLLNKFFVPSENYTIESKLKWFAGLCDSDGTVTLNGKTQSIQIASINKEFLKEVQLMLQTLGVYSKITISKEEGYNNLPANDGTGQNKQYFTQTVYRLLIANGGIVTLLGLGFVTYRLILSNHIGNRDAIHFVKITDVIDEGRIDDTYCFTEPKRNMGVFNGLLTGQCSEITLYQDEEHTYTCVLSSMNLTFYDDWKDTDAIFTATVFLDCVAEDFIRKAKGKNGFDKSVRFTEKGRSLGLGVCGFHTYLQKNMIAFESLPAQFINTEIFKKLHDESLLASKWLAEEYGEPEWCKGYGVRNTHRLAIAPTMSTALIMGGCSQGIEPVLGNAFIQSSAGGESERINPVFLELMKKRGKFTRKLVKHIADNHGSVQDQDWLTDDEKLVFRTAFEINQEVILRLASQRQKFICQAQSLNLFFSADESEKYIAAIHKAAIKDKYIKSLYYIRTQAGVSASSGECIACQ